MIQKKIVVESYAYIQNLDKSILTLNPIIKKDGYQFVEVSLDELGANFFNLIFMSQILIGKRLVINEIVRGENGAEFSLLSLLANNSIFSHSDFRNKSVIFLKRIKDFRTTS